ncbi:MAG: hypothetical protein M3493_12225 [Actinomycetota bacterium]|nr:hypothetical protein [Actinomycetota bacterium]
MGGPGAVDARGERLVLGLPAAGAGRDGSAAQAGLVGAVSAATTFLLRLPAGAFADRWHRRAVMLGSDAGRALAVGGWPQRWPLTP